ncbi:hypothetical protein A0H81_14430 [Grifola frondosa]|uniref:Uncharacterized protein n=1 Tax=Grifola frondosa TaxID=5627 RepID=A0A1C7LRZ5_GRIFR|nr:hypothetical protein A0H81_14430 [Grifola frondosa]
MLCVVLKGRVIAVDVIIDSITLADERSCRLCVQYKDGIKNSMSIAGSDPSNVGTHERRQRGLHSGAGAPGTFSCSLSGLSMARLFPGEDEDHVGSLISFWRTHRRHYIQVAICMAWACDSCGN